MNKKKIYFIISACFQVLLSFGSILMVDSTKKQTLDMIQSFPEVLRENIISVCSNDLFYIVPNIITILIALLILFIVLRKSIECSKTALLSLSIFSFLFASVLLMGAISIINIIVIATIPSKIIEREEKHIPILNRIDTDSKSFKLAIGCLICYFLQIFIPDFDSHILNVITLILSYLAVLIVCLFSFKEVIKRDFYVFKKNFKAYLLFLISRLFFMYVCYFILSFLCMVVLNNNAPVNQQVLNSLPIWILIPLACLYAPIVEELLFRGCIRRFSKNDIIYIIISGFIFGLLHTLGESSFYHMFTLMIPYAFIGSFFAYIYKKTNNIFSNIFCHCFHNSLAIIIQVLFMIF